MLLFIEGWDLSSNWPKENFTSQSKRHHYFHYPSLPSPPPSFLPTLPPLAFPSSLLPSHSPSSRLPLLPPSFPLSLPSPPLLPPSYPLFLSHPSSLPPSHSPSLPSSLPPSFPLFLSHPSSLPDGYPLPLTWNIRPRHLVISSRVWQHTWLPKGGGLELAHKHRNEDKHWFKIAHTSTKPPWYGVPLPMFLPIPSPSLSPCLPLSLIKLNSYRAVQMPHAFTL